MRLPTFVRRYYILRIFGDFEDGYEFSTPKLALVFEVADRTIERDVEKMLKWGLIDKSYENTRSGKYTVKVRTPGLTKIKNIFSDTGSR